MLSLPQTGHEHHGKLIPHVDQLAVIADTIGYVPSDVLGARLVKECRFINDQLVPHMQAAEATLYPELERLVQNRHSMTPMRREHEEMRRLIDDLGRMRDRFVSDHVGRAEEMGLCRILYRMFSIVKVHLAEEELYLGVLDHNLSDDEKDALARAMDHAVAAPM